MYILLKELSFGHKFWSSNTSIFSTWWCKPSIFQTIIMWSKYIYSVKYQRSPTFDCKDIGIRKSEFVAKTQFLLQLKISGFLELTLIFNLLKRNCFTWKSLSTPFHIHHVWECLMFKLHLLDYPRRIRLVCRPGNISINSGFLINKFDIKSVLGSEITLFIVYKNVNMLTRVQNVTKFW